MASPSAPSAPVILCMQDSTGQEVSLAVEPGDDFHTFLRKAKDLLGFDVDVSCITQNQSVSLSENLYDYLINADECQFNQTVETSAENLQQLLAIPSSNSRETVYILEDGTQIKASQSQNDDTPPALDVDKIPFVKYRHSRERGDERNVNTPRSPDLMKKISISQSPISRNDSVKSNPDFFNRLPFKPVVRPLHPELIKYIYDGKSEFNAHNEFPKKTLSVTKDYRHRNDRINQLTKSQILALIKDSPVKTSIFVDSDKEKPKHVRKSHPYELPTRRVIVSESNSEVGEISVAPKNKSQSKCYICSMGINNEIDEIYIFSSEDQKRYRAASDKELAAKVICKACLEKEFLMCLELTSEKSLENDEYLVLRHNQQYVYKKIKELKSEIKIEKASKNDADCDLASETDDSKNIPLDLPNVPTSVLEITENGDIIKKQIGENDKSMDEKLEKIKKKLIQSLLDKDANSSAEGKKEAKEIEDLDEQVQKFLSKETDSQMKCRFCSQVFDELDAVVQHGSAHHLSDEDVFPCPLCEYGYETLSWLRRHMRSKHRPQRGPLTFREEAKQEVATPSPSSDSEGGEYQSPVARRTRSSATKKRTPPPCRKKDKTKKIKRVKDANSEKSIKSSASTEKLIRILEGAKKDVGVADDDGIWIVESKSPDDDSVDETECSDTIGSHGCSFCSKRFLTRESLERHEARRCRAGRSKLHAPGPVRIIEDVFMPSEEDFLKRAKGRRLPEEQWLDEDDGTLRPRYRGRKKASEPTSDPSLLMCDDCGATFTSKVRLKFHIQFHGPCRLLADGRYRCGRCGGSAGAFATEAELFDHLHFSHGKRSRWLCPVSGCHKTFFLRAMLTKHSRAHTDTRRYVCGACDKRFLDKQTLDEHSVTHLKIKPFQCHLCLKQLTRRSRLRMHLRAHEEHLAPRLVRVCRICRRAFKDLPEAKEHASMSECGKPNGGDGSGGLVTMHIENADPDEPDKLDYGNEDVNENEIRNSIYEPNKTDELQVMTSEMDEATRHFIRVVEIEKAFRCEYCEDVFYMEGPLNAHRLQHKGVKNPFTCHICKVSFPTYSRCTTHKTTHGFFKRSVAEVKREVASDAGGARRQAGPGADGIVGYGDFPVCKHFLCEDCGRSYLHWTYLQVHRRMKHPAGDCVYRCSECDIKFPNSWGLAYHKRKMHGPNPPGEDRKSKTADLKLPCRDCQESFANRSALYAHRRKVHRLDRKPYTPKGLGLFSCATCGKCYAGRAGLDAHLRAHAADGDASGSAPYACARCGVTYASSAHLTRHVLSVHGEEASQMCATCGATYASPAQLSAHVRTHSPRRPHACTECSRAFRTASMLAEHMRVHTGERPYPCDICGVSFRRSTARRNHRLIHTGERAFACTQCPKRFRIRSDLRTHFRTKHPHQILVLEVKGLNPEPEAVIEKLHLNNIALDKVLEIAKISFPMGSANLMLDPSVTLENLQRSQDEGSAQWSERIMSALETCRPKRRPHQPEPSEHGVRRGRGIARRDRPPDGEGGALQLQYADQNTFHVEIRDVAVEELTELLGGVLTHDGRGVLLNSGQFVPFDSVMTGQDDPLARDPGLVLGEPHPGAGLYYAPPDGANPYGYTTDDGNPLGAQQPGGHEHEPLQSTFQSNIGQYHYDRPLHDAYANVFDFDNVTSQDATIVRGQGPNMFEGRSLESINEYAASFGTDEGRGGDGCAPAELITGHGGVTRRLENPPGFPDECSFEKGCDVGEFKFKTEEELSGVNAGEPHYTDGGEHSDVNQSEAAGFGDVAEQHMGNSNALEFVTDGCNYN